MALKSDVGNCWITLNRACNLRCKWCYAQDTGFEAKSDMPLDLAYNIIDICAKLGIRHVTLIGGEPTLYKDLDKVILCLKKNNIRFGIVTNGIKLANKAYLDSLILAGLESVSISLKGESKAVFSKVALVDAYDLTMRAIKNCKDKGIKSSVSMVLTNENIPSFIDGLVAAERNGASSFHLSFCYEFSVEKGRDENFSISEIAKITSKFEACYETLISKIKGQINLFQTLPFCLWNNNFLKRIKRDGNISSICQLQHGKSFLFDQEGSLIPCNAMHMIKLGKLGEDFFDAESLLKFRNSDKIKKVYKKLMGVPSEECLECQKLKFCGGGCVCQWTNFDFDELKKFMKPEGKIWK